MKTCKPCPYYCLLINAKIKVPEAPAVHIDDVYITGILRYTQDDHHSIYQRLKCPKESHFDFKFCLQATTKSIQYIYKIGFSAT